MYFHYINCVKLEKAVSLDGYERTSTKERIFYYRILIKKRNTCWVFYSITVGTEKSISNVQVTYTM